MSGEISEVERLKTEANALFKSKASHASRAPPATLATWLIINLHPSVSMKDYLKAAAAYSRAIKQHGSGDSAGLAVLYSNRSASLLKLNKVEIERDQDVVVCLGCFLNLSSSSPPQGQQG